MKLETYYIDGPMIFSSIPLYKLIKQHNHTWLGLQYVTKVTYANDIEDYELLLRFIITDRINILYNDSFSNMFKFNLTYEDVLNMYSDLNSILQQLISPLNIGQKSDVYAIQIKDRLLKFQGFINNGKPYIAIAIEKAHFEKIASLHLSLSKFKEFITVLSNCTSNWQSVISLTFYQMDRLGKSLVYMQRQLQQEINSIKHTLDLILQMLSSSNSSNTFIDDNNPKEDIKIQQNEIETTKEESVSKLEEPDIPNHTATDNNEQEDVSLDSIADAYNSMLNKRKVKEETVALLPLEMIDHVSLLVPYLQQETDLLQFVKQNEALIRNIFVKSGIDESYISDFGSLMKFIIALKDITVNNKEPQSIEELLLQELVKWKTIEE